MQITEQAHVIYTFKLNVKEALILKEMVQNSSKENEPEEVAQFRTTIWNYLPSIENLEKGN
jgi:hypothetical protein